ncbi:unnamed protein product [Alternaria alternata]
MGDYTVHFTTDPLDHILAGNLAYQKRTTARDPNAFTLLTQGQAPEILWIGCADSRIPKRLLRRQNKVELDELPNDDARSARVAELNVQQSIDVLKQHPAIKRAIAERGLSLHGLIYDIGAGQLKILEEAGGRKADSLRCPT